MKIKLVTFSDGSYALRAAGQRLARQADSIGWFNVPSEHWTLDTLRVKIPDFYNEHYEFIKSNPKGFGLWVWKPAILSYLIDNLKDDEVVLLLDSGCQLNSTTESEKRFNNYIELCSENGLLLMQIANNSFGFQDLSDRAWTKSTVLDFLDPLSMYRDSNQIQSGIIFAAKSEKSVEVSKKWLQYCVASNYSFLITPSDDENQPKGFRQHRWEQSILSLTAKSEGIFALPDETYFYPDWSNGLRFPIWAMRNRSGGDAFRRNIFDNLRIFLAKVDRYVIAISRYKN